MNRWTFLVIALGGAEIQAQAWPLKDGGYMPVIVKSFGCERTHLLVSWDDLSLPEPEAAESHAAKCIEALRAEAKKRGLSAADVWT